MVKEDTNEKTLGSLLHRLQDLTNKVDSLFQLTEEIWRALQDDDDDSYAPSDASTVELAE